MSPLPARLTNAEQIPRIESQAAAARGQTEIAIYKHSLDMTYEVECDRIDSQAVGDVMRASIDEQFAVIEYGRHKAGSDPALLEVVAQKAAMQDTINNSRIVRRFGS